MINVMYIFNADAMNMPLLNMFLIVINYQNSTNVPCNLHYAYAIVISL
jgi:hypothetical protein